MVVVRIKMTITYEEVRDAVDDIKWEDDFGVIECGGLAHLVLTCPEDEQGMPPGEYFFSQSVDGADITILDSLREEFRKPVILHEVAEFLLRKPYCSDDGTIRFRVEFREAHKTAREWDERYARETLDSSTFMEYLEFRRQFDY